MKRKKWKEKGERERIERRKKEKGQSIERERRKRKKKEKEETEREERERRKEKSRPTAGAHPSYRDWTADLLPAAAFSSETESEREAWCEQQLSAHCSNCRPLIPFAATALTAVAPGVQEADAAAPRRKRKAGRKVDSKKRCHKQRHRNAWRRGQCECVGCALLQGVTCHSLSRLRQLAFASLSFRHLSLFSLTQQSFSLTLSLYAPRPKRTLTPTSATHRQ